MLCVKGTFGVSLIKPRLDLMVYESVYQDFVVGCHSKVDILYFSSRNKNENVCIYM